MSDNSPPFNGDDFKRFAQDFDFMHTTSSPTSTNPMVLSVNVEESQSCLQENRWISPMLWLEHYCSYMTLPSWQIYLSSLNTTWMTRHKEQFFQDPQNISTYNRSGRDWSKFRTNRKSTLTGHTEQRIYKCSRSKNEYSSFPTSKGQQAHLHGWQELLLKSWIVDTHTWSKDQTAESTGGTELTYSPFAMTVHHFKTIQQKTRERSLKLTPFKIRSQPRWKPCPSRQTPAKWMADPCSLMRLTHFPHPLHHHYHHLSGFTHPSHLHIHHLHTFHSESRQSSPNQRTHHPEAGRDPSLNQPSSDPRMLTEDSHLDFQHYCRKHHP